MTKTKIAYILDSFPVLSETFIVREILELRKKEVEVSIFTLSKSLKRLPDTIIHADSESLVPDVRFAENVRNGTSKLKQVLLHLQVFARNPRRYCALFRMCKQASQRSFSIFGRSVLYARIFQKEKIEHIHAHFSLNGCTLAMLVSEWSAIPFSFTVHAHDIFIPGLAELMDEKLSSACFVASISEFNKNLLLEQYPAIEPKKFKIVRCGIDIELFLPRTAQRRRSFKILGVGRLHEQKGFEYLVRACDLLKQKFGLNFVCEIVGEGEERVKLETLIRDAGLQEHVKLLGALDQLSIAKALEGSDLFVLPCVAAKTGAMDGIPVALMEAMAKEIPVISTNVSGIPELIVPGVGSTVQPADANELSQAIYKVANQSHDERQATGRMGRTVIAAKFRLATEVEKLAGLFRSSSNTWLWVLCTSIP